LGDGVRPELRRVGNEQSPIVIVDAFSGRLDELLGIAGERAPYPPLNN